ELKPMRGQRIGSAEAAISLSLYVVRIGNGSKHNECPIPGQNVSDDVTADRGVDGKSHEITIRADEDVVFFHNSGRLWSTVSVQSRGQPSRGPREGGDGKFYFTVLNWHPSVISGDESESYRRVGVKGVFSRYCHQRPCSALVEDQRQLIVGR